MALPGLGGSGIPGLNASFPFDQSSSSSDPYASSNPAASLPRIITLRPQTEWRFESSFSNALTVKLLTGFAEIFGTELGPAISYTFKGAKGAVFSWQGCTIEVTGETEADYVAEETTMMYYANAHFALENLRVEATQGAGQAGAASGKTGPRVLIVGAENSGKSSLAKILTAYAVKSGRQPVLVNLDPRSGVLSVPGALTATAVASMLNVEEGCGWGSSPISGPTALPVKMPLVYQFGCGEPGENMKLYKALITRLGLSVKSRMAKDGIARGSGVIVDTPGALSTGKGGNYEGVAHIVSEFDINVLLVLGSERLYNDLRNRFAPVGSSGSISVAKLDKSGGCIDRDEAYMKQMRQAQIREYFFGHGTIPLSPHTIQVDASQLSIFKIVTQSTTSTSTAYDPGAAGADDDDDDFYEPTAIATSSIPSSSTSAQGIFEKVSPSSMMQNSLLAVAFAGLNDSMETIRDSAVKGFVYVAEFDEARRRMKLLSPVGGAAPKNAMIWGSWPEEVVGLVS